MIANSAACSISPPLLGPMFAQGNRIKGHRGARIHKTTATGQESPRGGSATTNNRVCTWFTLVGIFWIYLFIMALFQPGNRLCVTFTFEVSNSPFGVSLSHSAKEGFNGGDVELNESGSLWPPLGILWVPPSIVLSTINWLSN